MYAGADVAAASRPITDDELQACVAAGVTTLIETEIGYDGIVLAQSIHAKPISLTPRDLFLALAHKTPQGEQNCRIQINRRQQWQDVREDLPKREILVFGPPGSSGTRDMFLELLIKEGARSFPCLAGLEARAPDVFDDMVTLRPDGPWVNGGENDLAIATAVRYVHEAIGIFGFSHLDDTVRVEPIAIDGVIPSRETISNGSYPVTRQLFLYTDSRDYVSETAIQDVMAKFSSLESVGPNGVLVRLGLIVREGQGAMSLLDTATGARKPFKGLSRKAQGHLVPTSFALTDRNTP